MSDYLDGWYGTRIDRYHGLDGHRLAVAAITMDRDHRDRISEIRRATHSPEAVAKMRDEMTAWLEDIGHEGTDPFHAVAAFGLGQDLS